MNVLHILPAFYPSRRHGGPPVSAFDRCRYLAQEGTNVRVLTTNADGDDVLHVPVDTDVNIADRFSIYYCSRGSGKGIGFSIFTRIFPHVRWADVVHLSHVYTPLVPITFAACILFQRPLVWSLHGMLQRMNEGTRRLYMKRVWLVMCRALLPKQSVLHVTSSEEQQESMAFFPDVSYAVIPHGVDVPEARPRRVREGPLRLLALGRIHPQKGIEQLLSACAILSKTQPIIDWRLNICGDGKQAYTDTLQALTTSLEIEQFVTFSGHVQGEAWEDAFAQSDVLVVPSYRESFCLVVAEALARGVPVIASTGTPWQRLESEGCGLWVSPTPERIADAIRRIERMPHEEMGRKGRTWMAREFQWTDRTRTLLHVYGDLLHKRKEQITATRSWRNMIDHA